MLGKYSKEFVSDQITEKKFDLVYKHAISIQDYKNKISQEVCNDLNTYFNMSKYDFLKYVRNNHRGKLSSYNECESLTDVYNAYQNKFNAIIHKINFVKKEFVEFIKYKRDVPKNHKKKGDLKSIKYKNITTNLSITLTYLARYGFNDTVNYINNIGIPNAIKDNNQDKIDYYNIILKTINKFGFDRLYKLALSKKERILSKYKDKPVEFKSLTFRGQTSEIKTIIDYSHNKNSIISAFATINIGTNGLTDIPVKISNKYHGNLSDYIKNPDKRTHYMYTMKVNECNKSITIILSKDGVSEYPDQITNSVGIDVNLKHNLLCLSNGDSYDYDRKLVKKYLHELNKVDNLKEQNKEYKVGKRRQNKLDIYKRCIKHSTYRLIVDICKDLQSKGVDSIVLENLDNSFKRSNSKNKETDEKYTRLSHILNIGSIKDEFKHIAKNYGICVSFVQAEYTSQMCPICGSIHEENRPEQEIFECIECGYKSNADINAAINIKNRVDQAVLRKTLLKLHTDGSYVPKNIKHENILDKIQKCVIQLSLDKK